MDQTDEESSLSSVLAKEVTLGNTRSLSVICRKGATGVMVIKRNNVCNAFDGSYFVLFHEDFSPQHISRVSEGISVSGIC